MSRYRFSQTLTLLTLLLLGASITSCTQRSDQIPAPPVEFPDQFSLSGNKTIDARWWLDLKDPELTTLIGQALSGNFSLRIARDRLTEVKASARQAGALLSPAVDARANAATRQNYQTNSSEETLLLEFAASYEIDLWGRLAAARDAAVLDTQATQADLNTAAVSIAAEVAQTWYRIVETGLQQQLVQKQKETNIHVLELITVQFRAGQAGAADVLQQRQLVETNNAELAGLRRTLKLFEHQLSLLLGEAPGSYIFSEISTLPLLPPLPDTGLPIDLITRRPDIRSSYFQLQAADRRVASAVASRLPKLSISAELYSSDNRASDLFNNWFSSLIANLVAPVIDGGYLQAEVEKRQAAARQLLNRYGQTILQAIGEVEDALIQEKVQIEILDNLNIRLELAAQTVDHVATRYRSGAEDYQRVLLALLSHQELQRRIIESQLLLINYRISLYRALGGHIPQAGAIR
jgi:NodT family efflux transporter outer membrane factor (OMF) lipoprotein